MAKWKSDTLAVSGMSCSHCRKAVEGAVGRLDGVNEATVDLDRGLLKVTYDLDRVNNSILKKAVEDAGYEVEESGKEPA